MQSFKTYARLEDFPFDEPSEEMTPLRELMLSRRSERAFSVDPVSLTGLSYLLYYSAGFREIDDELQRERRPYPSAGAKYPLEIYPLIFRVEGLERGLYHYNVRAHSLELMLTIEDIELDNRIWLTQDWAREAAVILIVTAVSGRITEKYGKRGLQYALIEAGHLGQNIYLLSQEMGLYCCSIGQLHENDVNTLLDIDPYNEAAVYFLAVGK